MTAAVAATAGHQPPPNSRISPARMNPRLATQATADPAEAVDADPDGHEIAPPPVLRRTHRGSLRPRADGPLVSPFIGPTALPGGSLQALRSHRKQMLTSAGSPTCSTTLSS